MSPRRSLGVVQFFSPALCDWRQKHKHRHVTKGKSYYIWRPYDGSDYGGWLAAIPFFGSLSGHGMRDLFE